MLLKLAILASLGAFIGWMTNVMAIKMMFRPIKPIRLPFTPWYVQGLMPKRQSEIAKSIGDIINEELVSIEKIADEMIAHADKNDIIDKIKVKVVALAHEKMPAMIPSLFKGMILQNIEAIIDENGDAIVTQLGEELTHYAVTHVDIGKMIETQINAYDFEKLEEMIIRLAKKELKHIEVLGGVIGFAIGLVQGSIIMLLN